MSGKYRKFPQRSSSPRGVHGVPGHNIRSEPWSPGKKFLSLPDKIVEDLEHGRLAGTVVSDQSNALTTLDLERDIGKKCLLRKALGKFFYRENIVSTDNSRFQRKPHLALDLGRFLDPLDLTEHFFTAFCAADGFLTVEGFQLDDDGFLMLDVSLLVKVSLVLCVTKLCFLFGVSGVIATVHADLGGIDLNDLRYNFIKEITVMETINTAPG